MYPSVPSTTRKWPREQFCSQPLLRWFKGIWVCDLYCKVLYMMWNDPFWPSLVTGNGQKQSLHTYILLALKYNDKTGFICSPQYLYNMRAREQFCSQSLLRWFTVFVCKLQHQTMPWHTDYGHTRTKPLILCGPNSNTNPKKLFGMWI